MQSKNKKTSKLSTCKVCKAKYTKTRPLQTICNSGGTYTCAATLVANSRAKAAQKNKKAELKELRIRKEAVLTKSDWIKKVQVAFNGFIRARDADKPCISCGVPLVKEAIGGGFDCGHYRSVGSAPHLRFNDDNAHGQCKKCNRYGSGMAVDYRRGLIERIGLNRVEILESDQCLRKYTIDGLKAMAYEYRVLTRSMQKGG